jgi:hypothetical protein
MSVPMNAKDWARRLGGEVSGHDTILCPGPGLSPKDRSLTVKLDPAAPDEFPVHSYGRSRQSPAIGRQGFAINYKRNRHGATSLASVAKGVRLRHEKYPTSRRPARPRR